MSSELEKAEIYGAEEHHVLPSQHKEDPSTLLDYEDPHRAALENDVKEKISPAVILCVFFLGISLTGPIVFGYNFVAPSVAQLEEKLGNTSLGPWVTGSWNLGAAASFTLAGGISDVFGRRYVVLFGEALTVVAGIVCATAKTMPTFVGGQALLGLCIGFCSVAYAGLSEILPNKYRGIGLGWTEFNLAIWAIPSSLLSHYMLANASFHVWYYLCIGYGAVSFIGTALLYFPPRHPRKDGLTAFQHLLQLDYVGAVLFIGGLTCFLFGLNSGGGLFPWHSAGVIAPIIIGAICMVVAFVYDAKYAILPILPWELFRMFRGYSAMHIQMVVTGICFVACVIMISLQILFLKTSDPVMIGVYGIPSAAAGLAGALPGFVHKWKNITWQFIIANLMQTVFIGLMATTTNNFAWFLVCGVPATAGFGFITILSYTVASLNVPLKYLGVGIALIGTFRAIGTSLGSTVGLQIFESVAGTQVASRVTEAALSNGLPASSLAALFEGVPLAAVHVPAAVAFAKVPGITDAIGAAVTEAILESYKHAFKVVYAALVPFAFVGVVAAWFIDDPSKFLTHHVAIHLEKDALAGKKQ